MNELQVVTREEMSCAFDFMQVAYQSYPYVRPFVSFYACLILFHSLLGASNAQVGGCDWRVKCLYLSA